MLLDVSLLKFILLHIHWASCLYRWMFLIKFGDFQSFHLQIFFLFISFSLHPIGFIFCTCWYTCWCPTGLLGSVHFYLFFFPYVLKWALAGYYLSYRSFFLVQLCGVLHHTFTFRYSATDIRRPLLPTSAVLFLHNSLSYAFCPPNSNCFSFC